MKCDIGGLIVREVWKKWKPDCGFELKRKYHTEKMIDEEGELCIYLRDLDWTHHVKIEFPGFVHAYRNTEELIQLEYEGVVMDEEGNYLMSEWTFFIVENSSYQSWAGKESMGIYDPSALVHFAIIDDLTFFEVLTELPPRITEVSAI